MRVLVVEDLVDSSTAIVMGLIKAGHHVLRCQPIGAEVIPCAGLATPTSTCPIEQPADVVVQVHNGTAGLTMREYGVVCAGRQGTLIVNVGRRPSRAASFTTSPDRLVQTLAELERRPRAELPTVAVDVSATPGSQFL